MNQIAHTNIYLIRYLSLVSYIQLSDCPLKKKQSSKNLFKCVTPSLITLT
jgi:hypothetical protein